MLPTPAPVRASNPRLAELLARMTLEGYGTLRAQSIRLGIPAGALRNYIAGFPLPDDVARDIEWMMELPDGWLDGPAAAESPVGDRTQGMMAPA
ncbi:hypothetical protein ABIE56_000382 [Luteibacter sp. 621]|uniref:hypothetical protein n=1 Tax=Luteibacter sp. 621 TaxID=3373916 RepID=UPI003D20525B